MLWPRTRRQRREDSRGCSNDCPTTSGAMNSVDDVPHRLGGLAAVVRDCASATDSPQPSWPVALDADRARRCGRSERPKLVSKKCTSGRRSSERRDGRFSQACDSRSPITLPCDRALPPYERCYTRLRRGLPLHRHRRPDRRRARRGWPSGWRATRGHDRCSKTPRIRFSPTSTPTGPARRCRRSSSTCSTAIASRRAAAGRPVPADDGLRLPVRQGQDLRVPESRRQRALHLPAAVRSAGAATCRRPISWSTCRRRPTCCWRALRRPRPRARGRRAPARRRVPARAERGLPALLLPLHRDAAAGRRDLAVRSRSTTTRPSTSW